MNVHNNLNINTKDSAHTQYDCSKLQRLNCPNITRDSPTEQLNGQNMNVPIKRPNSTIGIPNSTIEPMFYTSEEFTPTTREKATSLTLDPKSYQNSQSNTPSDLNENPIKTSNREEIDFQNVFQHKNHLGFNEKRSKSCSIGSPRTSPRTSIVLNGNVLSSLSPIPPLRPPAPYSSKAHIHENPYNTNKVRQTISTSTMTAYQRSSYTEEEHLKLQEQYMRGRKDTIISIGKSFHIQIQSPSTKFILWKGRTCLEKCLIVTIGCLLLFFTLFSLTSFRDIETNDDMNKICFTPECVKTASSLLNAMDLTADPCEDFFQFACGTWNRKHIIPEDRSSISTFEVLADDLQIVLKDLLEQSYNPNDNSATIKAKVFYKSCMNTRKIEEIGDKPLRDAIKDLGGWPVLDQNWNHPSWNLAELLGRVRAEYNQGVIFEQWVGPDDRNSSINIIQLEQMSLGLPSRDYFLKESSLKDRQAYLKLMVEIAVLLGANRSFAFEEMTKVLDFETQLANISMPEADRHDTGAIYKKMSIRHLKSSIPEFDWILYFAQLFNHTIRIEEEVVVYSIDYFREMGKIISKEDIKIVQNYLIWRLVKYILPYLDGDYAVIRSEFKKILFGVSADRIRWTQCVELVNKKMGMAVGALFIRDNFDPKSKETAMEMIHNIRTAFNELLSLNDWMDESTIKVAQEKANAINERIGYPELLTNSIELSKEYQLLQVREEQFLQNILGVLKYEALKNLHKLRKPINKDRWTTEPAVVNAFYNPNKNDIVIPAGILQPLFYSQHFPKSLNYGGIGVVIGHEITHGFDDKGRQFDKEGNLKQWWNNKTIEMFRHRAGCIIDQYSSYVLEDIRLNVNGKMTQGENIADNGGLKQAYRAFKKWEQKNGVEPKLPGIELTHDQLFFLNYAQIWCGSMRPEDALSKVRSSVHSPGPIRVLGPLSNSYDFSNAYKCREGSRMNPLKKCSVW